MQKMTVSGWLRISSVWVEREIDGGLCQNWLMALTFVTFPPSPTRTTHIATTPIGVDHSNEIQMLQSSCVKRHPGCYPVGGKTINELLRNVLKILWSVLKLPHGNICVGAPPHLRHAFSPSPSLSLWDFLYEKNNNERLILKSKGN